MSATVATKNAGPTLRTDREVLHDTPVGDRWPRSRHWVCDPSQRPIQSRDFYQSKKSITLQIRLPGTGGDGYQISTVAWSPRHIVKIHSRPSEALWFQNVAAGLVGLRVANQSAARRRKRISLRSVTLPEWRRLRCSVRAWSATTREQFWIHRSQTGKYRCSSSRARLQPRRDGRFRKQLIAGAPLRARELGLFR